MRTNFRTTLVVIALCFVTALTSIAAADEALTPAQMMRQPTVSPDGSVIAFVHNGDIYTAPASGGEATRLVFDAAIDHYPKFSPDGAMLAFTSERTGGGDIFLVEVATGVERRLTHHSAAETVESWSPDGTLVYFSSSYAEISGYSDIFAAPVSGGTPFPVSRARYEGEYHASVSPDGDTLLFNINDRVRQWWRTGPRSDDSTEIWMRSTAPAEQTMQRMTVYEGKDSWPIWAPDSRGFFFVTDRFLPAGVENLAYRSLKRNRVRQITRFQDGRVLWPSISTNGDIYFERDFEIWHARENEEPKRLNIILPAPVPAQADQQSIEKISEMAATPDLKSAALVIHGDVFHLNFATEKLTRITQTPEPERAIAIDARGEKIAYAAMRDEKFDLFIHDTNTEKESKLSDDPETESHLRFSPDGQWLAFAAGTTILKAMRLSDNSVHAVADGSMLEPASPGRRTVIRWPLCKLTKIGFQIFT